MAKTEEIESQIKYGNARREKTLWNGLRFSNDTQAVFLYPSIFLLRRVVYALLLVYGPKFAYW